MQEAVQEHDTSAMWDEYFVMVFNLMREHPDPTIKASRCQKLFESVMCSERVSNEKFVQLSDYLIENNMAHVVAYVVGDRYKGDAELQLRLCRSNALEYGSMLPGKVPLLGESSQKDFWYGYYQQAIGECESYDSDELKKIVCSVVSSEEVMSFVRGDYLQALSCVYGAKRSYQVCVCVCELTVCNTKVVYRSELFKIF